MDFAAQIKTITETSLDTYWAKAYVHDSVYIVAEISGAGALPKGTAFFETVTQNLINHPPESLSAFKALLDMTHTEYPAVTFSAALLIKNVLYVAVSGAGAVFISRHQKAIPIIKENGSASGLVQENDLVLLTTKDFVSNTPNDTILNGLITGSFTAVSGSLEAHLPEKNRGAAVLIAFRSRDAKITEYVAFSTISEKERVKVHISTAAKPFITKISQIKPIAVLAAGLIIVLGISIYFGIKQTQEKKNASSVTQTVAEVTHKFEEGLALIDLNPIRSRQLLAEAKALLDAESQKSLSDADRKVLGDYTEKVAAGLTAAQRDFSVVPTPFFELDLLKSQGIGVRLALYQDALIILDRQHQSLYRLSIDSKASKIINSSDILKSARAIAVYGEEIYVFADGVYRLQSQTTGLEQIIAPDTEVLRITDMFVFGGNVYLLDAGKNWIWKYLRTETGFSSRQDYVLFDTIVDLSQATDMGIDGSVWVANGAEVLRFTQGKEDVWQAKGLEQSLGSHLDIYVDHAVTHTYVLDRDNRRVVILDKDGTYLAQYRWNTSLEVTDFVVSEVVKKILLLSRGTIYGIDLK